MTSFADRIGAPAPVSLPQHPAVASWRAATIDDVDAIAALHQVTDRVDHPTWITPREDVADTFELPHFDAAHDSLLAFDADGALVAYGTLLLHPSRSTELAVYTGGTVHPDHRRSGIGTALFGWQKLRAHELLASVAGEVADDVTAEVKAYAEETNPGAIALAEAGGFHIARWFTSMVRDQAEPVPGVEMSDAARAAGIRVIRFTHDRDDDARVARNDAFRDHWGSLPSDPTRWKQFVGGENFRADLSRIAVDADDRIVAFCLQSVIESDWEALGASHSYIDLIGVVRDHRRQGLAPLVIAAALHAAAEEKLEKVVLDVDTASPTGANTLYENLGFVATTRDVALVLSY